MRPLFAAGSLALVIAVTLLAQAACTMAPPPIDELKLDAGEDAGLDAGTPPSASEYCELTAEIFCPFYVRCGRMAVTTLAECRELFHETCNARYEPRYVDLANAGELVLSREGIDACAAHLASVECGKQPQDLMGPCASMWIGTSDAGEACSIDVESFVCKPGTVCVLGLNFCGTCEPSSARGGPCAQGGLRCNAEDVCIDGVCQARSLPGEACGDGGTCVTGSSCVSGLCVAPEIVQVGGLCDQAHRCPYAASCESGTCVRTSRLGGTCASNRDCMSGRCEAGLCVALREDGAACSSSSECASAQCISGACRALPSLCFGP